MPPCAPMIPMNPDRKTCCSPLSPAECPPCAFFQSTSCNPAHVHINPIRYFEELHEALENAPPYGTIILTQDVTASPVVPNYNWVPVAINDGVNIIGNGHKIGSESDPTKRLNAPLIGNGATAIKDIFVENLTIYANTDPSISPAYTAALAQHLSNSQIVCVKTFGTVESNQDYTAGIVAFASGKTTFTNCENYANVTGMTYVGGICAGTQNNANPYVVFTNCVNHGTITSNQAAAGNSFVGGIAGTVYYSKLEYCVNDTSVFGNAAHSAGIAAYANNTAIQCCTNMGSVTGTRDEMAGICSYLLSNSHVNNCVNHGSVRGVSGSDIGGIVSTISANSSIEDCVNFGNVSGPINHAGGIASHADGATIIKNNVNKGQISCASMVGGIIGVLNYSANTSRGYVTDNINEASVTGTGADVGGIAGAMSSNGTIENNCVTRGVDVRGTNNIGGIVGLAGVTTSGAGLSIVRNNTFEGKSVYGSGTGVRRIIGHYVPTATPLFTLMVEGNKAALETELTGSNASLTDSIDTVTPIPGTPENYAGVRVRPTDIDLGLNRFQGFTLLGGEDLCKGNCSPYPYPYLNY